MKKIIIAGGGTGGHLYPGICLARKLKESGIEPVFAVKRNDLSIPILRGEGFRFFKVRIKGMPRKFSPVFILFIFNLIISTLKSLLIVKKEKPGAVVGLGGFISFPAVISARILGIPVIIHEQNIIPGLANKVLSHFADRIAVSFPGSEKYWDSKKVVVTGNPVRPEIKGISRSEGFIRVQSMGSDAVLSKEVFTVLVFGGSQGASVLNTGIASCLEALNPVKKKIQFIHVSGEFDFCWVKKIYESKKYNAAVFPYINKMGFAYAAADLVISRAGATTIAELTALKKPSILVPYARATNNHQEYNARFLTGRGAALLVLEKDFDCPTVAALLAGFVNEPSRLENLRKSYSEIELEDSGDLLAKLVTDLLY